MVVFHYSTVLHFIIFKNITTSSISVQPIIINMGGIRHLFIHNMGGDGDPRKGRGVETNKQDGCIGQEVKTTRDKSSKKITE